MLTCVVALAANGSVNQRNKPHRSDDNDDYVGGWDEWQDDNIAMMTTIVLERSGAHFAGIGLCDSCASISVNYLRPCVWYSTHYIHAPITNRHRHTHKRAIPNEIYNLITKLLLQFSLATQRESFPPQKVLTNPLIHPYIPHTLN